MSEKKKFSVTIPDFHRVMRELMRVHGKTATFKMAVAKTSKRSRRYKVLQALLDRYLFGENMRLITAFSRMTKPAKLHAEAREIEGTLFMVFKNLRVGDMMEPVRFTVSDAFSETEVVVQLIGRENLMIPLPEFYSEVTILQDGEPFEVVECSARPLLCLQYVFHEQSKIIGMQIANYGGAMHYAAAASLTQAGYPRWDGEVKLAYGEFKEVPFVYDSLIWFHQPYVADVAGCKSASRKLPARAQTAKLEATMENTLNLNFVAFSIKNEGGRMQDKLMFEIFVGGVPLTGEYIHLEAGQFHSMLVARGNLQGEVSVMVHPILKETVLAIPTYEAPAPPAPVAPQPPRLPVTPIDLSHLVLTEMTYDMFVHGFIMMATNTGEHVLGFLTVEFETEGHTIKLPELNLGVGGSQFLETRGLKVGEELKVKIAGQVVKTLTVPPFSENSFSQRWNGDDLEVVMFHTGPAIDMLMTVTTEPSLEAIIGSNTVLAHLEPNGTYVFTVQGTAPGAHIFIKETKGDATITWYQGIVIAHLAIVVAHPVPQVVT